MTYRLADRRPELLELVAARLAAVRPLRYSRDPVASRRLYTPEFAGDAGRFRAGADGAGAPDRGRSTRRSSSGISLAIAETLAERFPDRPFWPGDLVSRGLARSLAAEMHAGFGALRRSAR